MSNSYSNDVMGVAILNVSFFSVPIEDILMKFELYFRSYKLIIISIYFFRIFVYWNP